MDVKSLKEENKSLRKELSLKVHSFENIVGKSKVMKEVFELIERVAESKTNILILGESGTGKELIAKAIHNLSRRKGNFVPVNCAAIPDNLLESELFGHMKGAFTGAIREKIGKFEFADGGTIFLDEIGFMKKELQAKLMRVLQERKIEKIGGLSPISIDVRVISATNANLENSVRRGEFRDDLYFRLNVVSIFLPTLSERKEDIPLLVDHFLKKFGHSECVISKEVMEIFEGYSWPGNVRELENCIERALLGRGKEIRKEHLPENIVYGRDKIQTFGNEKHFIEIPREGINLEELEKELILQALNRNGNPKNAILRVVKVK